MIHREQDFPRNRNAYHAAADEFIATFQQLFPRHAFSEQDARQAGLLNPNETLSAFVYRMLGFDRSFQQEVLGSFLQQLSAPLSQTLKRDLQEFLRPEQEQAIRLQMVTVSPDTLVTEHAPILNKFNRILLRGIDARMTIAGKPSALLADLPNATWVQNQLVAQLPVTLETADHRYFAIPLDKSIAHASLPVDGIAAQPFHKTERNAALCSTTPRTHAINGLLPQRQIKPDFLICTNSVANAHAVEYVLRHEVLLRYFLEKMIIDMQEHASDQLYAILENCVLQKEARSRLYATTYNHEFVQQFFSLLLQETHAQPLLLTIIDTKTLQKDPDLIAQAPRGFGLVVQWLLQPCPDNTEAIRATVQQPIVVDYPLTDQAQPLQPSAIDLKLNPNRGATERLTCAYRDPETPDNGWKTALPAPFGLWNEILEQLQVAHYQNFMQLGNSHMLEAERHRSAAMRTKSLVEWKQETTGGQDIGRNGYRIIITPANQPPQFLIRMGSATN